MTEGRRPIVEVRDVTKCYGAIRRGNGEHGGRGIFGRRGSSDAPYEPVVLGGGSVRKSGMTLALDRISFSIDTGEFVGIMGPSGSGKSSLLNCLATIDRPTNGQIIIGGNDIGTLSSRELARFRREELGFVFQDSNLLDTLTIRENIALALTLSHLPAREVVSQVDELSRRLGIEETLDRYPYEVSGGQKQRAAAARAVIAKPHLVLADEPTGALDSKSARELMSTLGFLHTMGATILMVTHDSSIASYCDRIIFIRDGRLWGQMSRGSDDRKTFLARIIAATSQLEEGDGYDA